EGSRRSIGSAGSSETSSSECGSKERSDEPGRTPSTAVGGLPLQAALELLHPEIPGAEAGLEHAEALAPGGPRELGVPAGGQAVGRRAALGENAAEVVPGARHRAAVLAEQRDADGERLAEQLLGLREPSAVLEQRGQIVVAHRGVEILLAEDLQARCQALAIF